MKTVWRVFAYLKRYPWMAAGTLTCAILSTLMVIVFPAATKWIINDVVRASRPDKLLPLIALVAAAFLLQHGRNESVPPPVFAQCVGDLIWLPINIVEQEGSRVALIHGRATTLRGAARAARDMHDGNFAENDRRG